MELRVASAVFGLAALFLSALPSYAQSEPEDLPPATPAPSPTASPSEDPSLFGFEPNDAVAAVTRSSERVEDAPGLIAVFGEREIRERGYRTLADLLADVPGFYLEPDERRTVVLTRGLPQSVLIVYDGVPLISDTGRDDLPVGEELSLDHVGRVEVLRGPGTALWGANAFNGIVNVVSADGRDVDGVRVRGEAGSGGVGATEGSVLSGAGASAGARGDRVEWSVGARAFREDGSDRTFRGTPRQYVLFDPVSIPVGARADGGGAPQDSLYGEAVGKLRWKNLQVVSRWSDFSSRAALSSYSHSLLESDRNEKRRAPTLTARAAWTEGEGPWSWTAGVFYLRSLHDDRYPLFARAAAHRFGGEIAVRAVGQSAGVDARGEIESGVQTLSGGVFVSANDTTLATDYVDPSTGTRTENAFRRSFRNEVVQVYAQDRILLGSRVRLTLGASFDDQSDFQPSVNPRAGLVVRLGRGWIGKALYGEAIRTPDAYDLIGISGGTVGGSVAAVSGNPSLSPEKVRTGELAAEYRRGSIATGSIALFGSRADDLIEDRAQGGEVSPVNTGSRYAAGLETHGTWAPAARVALHGAYTFTRSSEDPDGLSSDPLPASPEHVAMLGASWSPLSWTSLYLASRFVGRRELRGEGDRDRLAPYVLTDAQARFGEGRWPVGVSLRVRNLFDTRHHHRNEAVPGRNVAVEIPGARRTVILSLEGRF